MGKFLMIVGALVVAYLVALGVQYAWQRLVSDDAGEDEEKK